jgi:tRNA G10  N-methylase Trm11
VAEQLAQADPVFYTGKASQAERDEGLSGRNGHPCIKPLSLCTWLATLLLPPAAYAPRRLLVPFCGTGSEMIGAVLTGGWEEIVGIEQDPATVALGTQRLTWWTTQIAAQLSLWPS